ncbi:MAG: hypothetical protein BWX97_00005 [Firmicutes bacterium ADurb.Bin146]|nr:MAG: hypothetical protein BWX97_00005 [Firmicutes bacterium ADurb.Bin146]
MKPELVLLREYAKKYAQLALSESNLKRPDQYRKLNSLEMVKPPILVFEVPWGELEDQKELKLECETDLYRGIERAIKRTLYQFKNFEGDYAIHPYYKVKIRTKSTGIGLNVEEVKINSTTGTDISAHEYHDVLPDEDSLENITMPTMETDNEATQRALEAAHEVFDGIMDVGLGGYQFYFNMWDELPRYHGVEKCLIDIYDRPEFMHKMMKRFTDYHEEIINLYEKLNILETDAYYLHCTPACTYELPVKDITKEKVSAKDVWGRGMAQIFAVVSPDMHKEFDIGYMKRLFDRCGLTYYGCCEPLDKKIDILREFTNLRRISITPWADADVAADAMGDKYVLSAKSNPAYVSQPVFDPQPVIEETKKILLGCKRNNTPCEFILKDISTINRNQNHLTQWVKTVSDTIDRYW